jgi:methionyl-tRNA synthetase
MNIEQDATDLIYLNDIQADPPKLQSAPAEGLPCDQCGEIIEPSQIEYRLEGIGEDVPARLHLHCYPDWCKKNARG